MSSFRALSELRAACLLRRAFRAISLLGLIALLTACGGGGGDGGGGGGGGGGPPTLTSISVGPASATVAAGLTLQFTATGMYSDGTQKDVTSSATWASATTSVATISAGGLATGVAQGTSSISATIGTVSGNDTLTVGAPTLVSVTISPDAPNVAVRKTLQFSAIGKYTDNSTRDLTSTASWSSSDQAVASIAATTGVASTLTMGTTQIGASVAGGPAITPVMLTVTATIYAYATNFDGSSVSQYKLGTSGALTPLSPATAAAGAAPFSISVEPTGEYVYVSNWNSSNVSQYKIGSDGTLSPVGSGTVTTGMNPNSITLDHASPARYAYVANLGESTISQFTIGPDGALSPMSTPKVGSGNGPAAIVVDPSNRFAYAANFGSNTPNPPAGPSTISQYSIGTDGSLTALSTATVACGNGPNSLALHPSGKYLYVVNLGDGTVGQYDINADGTLSPMSSATVPTGGTRSFAITLDPAGKYAYVANSFTNDISQFTISPTDGSLSPMTPQRVNAVSGVSSVTVDPTGSYLYATNRGDVTISQYTIGANGALTPMASPTVQAGQHPTSLAIGY